MRTYQPFYNAFERGSSNQILELKLNAFLFKYKTSSKLNVSARLLYTRWRDQPTYLVTKLGAFIPQYRDLPGKRESLIKCTAGTVAFQKKCANPSQKQTSALLLEQTFNFLQCRITIHHVTLIFNGDWKKI